MDDMTIYLVILAAIAIGWWLGRSRWWQAAGGARKLPGSYYQGLNYLLNEEPDRAVSAFVKDLHVTEETLETHLALGNMLRRRGEVEKALIVHENILSAENLARTTVLNVQLELARDYVLAGLVDRAEDMLARIVNEEQGDIRNRALKMLLEIEEQMRDWHKAINTAEMLAGDADGDYENRVSHYYCELAEEAIEEGDHEAANALLSRAVGHSPKNARCNLIMGRLHLLENQPQAAAQTLMRIGKQSPAMVAESLALLQQAHVAGGVTRSELKTYLEAALAARHSISIVLALAAMMREEAGDETTARYVASHLKATPTIRGLTQLIDYHMDNAHGVAKENLAILRSFTEALIADKPSHRCQQCGFFGKKIHWHCPTCKNWGSIQPVYGLEGE